ncbi:MAG: glutamate--tRNA ligase, partial [Bacteroidota bacterium]
MRVRFAPSPTGYLHIGGLRTALYNYLFARKHGGTFVLRIEDTDRERFVEDAEADILAMLDWAGLSIDEGPDTGGAAGPYRQSERAELYQAHVQQLIDAGLAYHAFDSKDALDAMRERTGQGYNAQTRQEMENALTLDADEVQRRIDAGDSYVVRLKVTPGESVRFEDHVRGEVEFSTDDIDDQVLLKSDGLPTYHLANVVDDHHMGITHVIRGEEWLPSTPKHILLYEAFGWTPPGMAHLPLILSPNGGKLSKRKADKMGIPVSVRQYVDAGYEAPALVNFLAMLGWSPGGDSAYADRETFTLDELVDAFHVSEIGQSGAKFDLDKLDWYNANTIRELTPAG